jgi:hypothetical protein
MTVFYKYASASESSVSLDTSAKAVVLAYRGVRTITPTDGTSTFSTSSSTSIATNTFSTTLSNDYIVSVFGAGIAIGNRTFTAPASTTTRVNSSGIAFVSGTLLVVDELFSSSGTTTSRTATLNGNANESAFAFALTPDIAPRYWVGGSGTWNTSSNTNWSLTSGGTGGVTVPNAECDVYFDQAGTYTVTCTGALVCKNLNVTSGSVTFFQGTSPTFAISGSMSLVAGTVWSATGAVTFNSTSTGETITTNGTTISGAITINGVGGAWTLGSAWTSSSSITLTNGSFNASTYDVTCTTFSSSNSNARTLSLGSGTWTLSGTGVPWNTNTNTNLTFNKGTANIVLSDTSTSTRQFSGGGLTYNKLTIGGTTGTSTLIFTGSSTFSELASTKTVAHTIQFTGGTTTTVTTWSITGTSGNVVTLNSSTATAYTLAKAGGGYLTGIDYLDVSGAIGSPISDTWYIGENSVINTTAPNQGYAMFTTQRQKNAVIVLTSTTSASWDVPSDFNRYNNAVHLIGGGGGGAGATVSGTNVGAGGGGGGAGYTKLTNQTISGSITYQCGAAGTGGAAGGNGGAGGTTSWNSGSATAGGGGGGQSTSTSSTGGAAGVGTTFNGGTGGVGSTSTAASTGNGGGGGGGAGGPNGNGGSGGNGAGASAGYGGGGGGNGGGTSGSDATTTAAGNGGNNSSGAGGGVLSPGAVGGGGSGMPATSGGTGGPGIDIFGIGSGGGGGGDASASNSAMPGGPYGGGGSGGGATTTPTARSGRLGAQGAIIITYEPNRPKHRLKSTGDLITNTYLDEISGTKSQFGFNAILGTLDEVTNKDTALRITKNNIIKTKGIFDEVNQFYS